jgi:site-specific DNA-methyltransferase (adenine-specific)
MLSPPQISNNFKGHHIFHGDTLSLLQQFPDQTFDSIITDPPYASGGLTVADRIKATCEKYTDNKTDNPLPDFLGDQKDQRSWRNWMTEILREGRRVLKDGGVVVMFIDWRQLPSLTDAFQWADLLCRGWVCWDKGPSARPQLGRFRNQCEYAVWGSKGDMPLTRNAPCLNGCWHVTTKTQDKLHQTEKPLELMREIVQITEKGGLILDPFAGSGTTCVAAKQMGYQSVGIEITQEYCDVARKRLSCEVLQQPLFPIDP